MKTLQTLKFGLLAIGTVALTTSPTPALADQPGPYYATPSWDQQLPASTRFIVLSNWGGAAVLDRETGLVWEKSPDATLRTWRDAQIACLIKNLGARKGWKLPSIQELASLVDGDPANTSSPRLPPGHPFTNVQLSFGYWSASTVADSTTAWVVGSGNGVVSGFDKSDTLFVWCVRGGPGGDPQ